MSFANGDIGLLVTFLIILFFLMFVIAIMANVIKFVGKQSSEEKDLKIEELHNEIEELKKEIEELKKDRDV